MHSAPSVSFPVGRSRYAGRLLLGIWIVGAASALASSLLVDGVGWRTAVLLGSSIGVGAFALRAHRRDRPGQLRFDGLNWSLTGARAFPAARIVPALDLQAMLLVHLVVAGRRPHWLWLERGSDPQCWLALRRAVYSRAPSPDPADPIAAVQRPTGSSPSSS